MNDLEKLPGIGPYTSSAVVAFAYNQPSVCIETNIRTAVIYHYFQHEKEIPESCIRDVVIATLDRECPREWYWALMDYGAYLKGVYGNLNRQATMYQKQSTFIGSDREIRGAIIRHLTTKPFATLDELQQSSFTKKRVEALCRTLCDEGFLEQVNIQTFRLRS